MKIWAVDGRNIDLKDQTRSLRMVEPDPPSNFEELIEQEWPEETMFWHRPFCHSIALTNRHADADTWQCGSMCSEDHEMWCRRERNHRGKCSDILTRTDRKRITERMNTIRLEELDNICGKRSDTTARSLSIKQLRKILREEP